MQTQEFSLVLSGNCLLLLSADLDQTQRRDAIDSQLFAWLNASAAFLMLGENEQWYGTYMDRHTGLGWVLNAFAEKIKVEQEPASSTLLANAWQGLGPLVPAQVQPALNNAFKMLQALPSTHPVLQVLSTEAFECVQDPGSKPVTRLALEVRVVLPGLRTVACSVYLETRQIMEGQWLTQELRVKDINRQVTRGFSGELYPGVFSGVRALLEKRLEALRSMYVMPVNIREGAA